MRKKGAYEAAFYIDDKISITDFLSLNMGIRISSFFSFGPQTVLSYNPGFSKNRSNISDTINFKGR
ncbi:MAG: hypothetical protein IPH69_12755 [Bacteroidales bacterium]|nr:hypothetical protein [Bacteroidales bacterium]